jgi:two-component system, OmpR family, alkaline phosphatase synthesis response regulator PhoP
MNEGLEIVLVEDDDEAAVKMLRFLKATFTNTVLHMRDGAEAANFLLFPCNSIPKLFLVDLVLPELDGVELYRMIRLEPEKRNLSVIFLVNSLEEKDRLESLGLHPDGYLKKPTAGNFPARI